MSTPDRAPTVIVHKPTFAQLPLVAITPSRSNPRKHFDAGKLAELAASIAAFGVHQPIIVRPLPGDRVADTHRAVQYELVCGERRYRASQQAQVDTIPAMIRALTDDEVLEVQIVENLQRTDLSELEEAEGYEALMQHSDLTADQVGAKIGKSRSYVYARLKLLDLSVECKQALREGRSPATLARIFEGRKLHGSRFLTAYYGNESGGRSLSRPVGTITTRDRWAVIDGDRMRMLSVNECRQAMGFPASYQLPTRQKDAMHMLGNAVVPVVACDVINTLKKAA